MRTSNLTVLALSLATFTAAGCNNHPLDDVQMNNFGDDGGTGGATDGDDDESGEDGEDMGEDDNGFPNDDGPNDDDGVPPDCGGDIVEVDTSKSNVMLVLDKSGSMHSNTWDHDADADTAEITRWNSLHNVVTNVVNDYGDTMNMGAALFPATDADHNGGAFEDACSMADDAEVSIAADNGAAILAAIPGATDEVRGGTPTREGILNALDHLLDVDDAGPKAMILVTDGAANCVPGVDPFHSEYDFDVPLAVGSAFTDNEIPTYVIGINIDDETLDNINGVAEAGGRARDEAEKFYNVFDQVELQSALDTIAAQVECTVALSQFPADPDYVDVIIGDQSYDQLDTCADGDGWRFTDDQGPYDQIELCGAACDAFRNEGRLETDYTCPPVG